MENKSVFIGFKADEKELTELEVIKIQYGFKTNSALLRYLITNSKDFFSKRYTEISTK